MANVRFPYHFEAGKKPFSVRAMYHDDRFTYIQARPEETPTLYELKDGQPNLVNFTYKDGVYVIGEDSRSRVPGDWQTEAQLHLGRNSRCRTPDPESCTNHRQTGRRLHGHLLPKNAQCFVVGRPFGLDGARHDAVFTSPKTSEAVRIAPSPAATVPLIQAEARIQEYRQKLEAQTRQLALEEAQLTRNAKESFERAGLRRPDACSGLRRRDSSASSTASPLRVVQYKSAGCGTIDLEMRAGQAGLSIALRLERRSELPDPNGDPHPRTRDSNRRTESRTIDRITPSVSQHENALLSGPRSHGK